MSVYSTPTILKEELGNGKRIPIILYELNPLHDPNNRINHYRNVFDEKANKSFPYFKVPKKKKNKKPKSAWKAKSTLYNSYYAKLFLRINFDRPREIKNDDGVIISRHFKSLYVNSKEYPKQKYRSFSLRKRLNNEKISFKERNHELKNYNENFFSTQIKFNSNKNTFPKQINSLKNLNNLNIGMYHNIFSRTSYINNGNNFLTNKNRRNITISQKENSKNNNLSSSNTNKGSKTQTKILPLLFKAK